MYTVTSHAVKKKWGHPQLPAPPFRCLIVGPSGTGKSCIISSMLSFEPYKQTFKKNCFFFSPTMREDPEYSHLKIKDENIFDTYDSEALMDLYESQRTAKKKGGRN